MPRYARLILLLLFIGLYNAGYGQSLDVSQNGFVWQRIYLKLNVSNRVRVDAEAEHRNKGIKPQTTTLLLPRLQLHYNFRNHMNASFGVSHFVNYEAIEQSMLSVPFKSEFRMQQGYHLKNPGKSLELSHRLLLEQRFFLPSYNSKYASSDKSFLFAMRLRYLLQVQSRIVSFSTKASLFLKCYNELLLQASVEKGNQLFEANRIYAALNVEFNSKWSVEAGYLTWLRQVKPSSFQVPHILRITLYHTIDFQY